MPFSGKRGINVLLTSCRIFGPGMTSALGSEPSFAALCLNDRYDKAGA